MVASAPAFLLATQNPDSGWGYAAGQASTVEATAASVLALRDEPAADLARRASLAWLGAAQHADGGWGLGAGDPESGWPTAWGVLALTAEEAAADAVRRGAAWLLTEATALDAVVHVASLDCELPVAEIYAKVDGLE